MKKHISRFVREALLIGASAAIVGSSMIAYNATAGNSYASEISQNEEYANPLPKPAKIHEPQKTNAVITFFYCKQEEGYTKGDGGGFCGYFANGEKVTQEATGRVAACGRQWNLGTKIYIPEYGRVECVDRGYLENNQVDVFFYRNSEGWNSKVPDIRHSEVEVLSR